MNSKSVFPKWVLISALALFVVVGGVILWTGPAAKDYGSRIDLTPRTNYSPGVSVMGPEVRRAVVPPDLSISPTPENLPDLRRPSATVTITPVPTDESAKATSNALRRARANAVGGMFPFGSISGDFTQPSHLASTKPAELFPRFSYAGKQWSYTGRVTVGKRIEMTPTGFSVGNRQVFALAGSDNPGSVLFVQSARDQDNYAIYRSNDSSG
ncbi:MAG: hypothetical protein ACYC64_12670 [Armatimonadota bacterium]